MLRSLIRGMAVVTVVIVAVLSYFQLSLVEQEYPLGTDRSGTILFSSSNLAKEQILDGIQEISRNHDIDVYLGAPNKDDPFHGLDLYALGDRQPAGATDIVWIDFLRHGKLYPAKELGDTNLSAVYALKGPAAGVEAFERWAQDNGATVSWSQGGPLAMFAAGLVYGGAGTPLIALAVLGVTVVLAWYAARAESRAVRLLAGTSDLRIQAQDMLGWLRLAVPIALVGVLLLGILFGVLKGFGGAPTLIAVVGLYLCLLGGISVVFGVVASLVTAPSVKSLALRRPPEARFEFPSQLLKAVALTLGLAALPAMLWQVNSSLDQADIQGRAMPLKGYVSQAVGGVTNEEFENSIGVLGRFVGAVDETGTVAYASIVNREDPGPEFSAEGFDGLAVINKKYAEELGLGLVPGRGRRTLVPVPMETVERLLKSLEGRNVGGISGRVRKQNATALENGLTAYRFEDSEGIIAPTGNGLGFKRSKHPLLLVSERITASFNDDAVVSAMTNGEIMFGDTGVLEQKARELGVTSMFLSRSRVTDSALLSAQFANQTALTTGTTIVILLAAIAVSGWLSARVYATNNARFIYPMLTYGRGWWSVLRNRIIVEGVIIVLTFVIVSVVYLAFGLAWSPILMLGVLVYLIYSGLCHQRAAFNVVARVTQRAH